MPRISTHPDDAMLAELHDLRRRVAALERGNGRSIRFTAPDGAYVEVGVLDATGLVGVRVFNNSPTQTFAETAT